VCVTAVIVGVCAGAALAKPHVSLSLPDSANAHAAVPFSGLSANKLSDKSAIMLADEQADNHASPFASNRAGRKTNS
jgi:hypothetical protein